MDPSTVEISRAWKCSTKDDVIVFEIMMWSTRLNSAGTWKFLAASLFKYISTRLNSNSHYDVVYHPFRKWPLGETIAAETLKRLPVVQITQGYPYSQNITTGDRKLRDRREGNWRVLLRFGKILILPGVTTLRKCTCTSIRHSTHRSNAWKKQGYLFILSLGGYASNVSRIQVSLLMVGWGGPGWGHLSAFKQRIRGEVYINEESVRFCKRGRPWNFFITSIHHHGSRLRSSTWMSAISASPTSHRASTSIPGQVYVDAEQ